MKRTEISDDSKPLPEPVEVGSSSLSTNEVFLELIEQARAEFREGKTLSFKEMKWAVLP
jgi:hypothetical protein